MEGEVALTCWPQPPVEKREKGEEEPPIKQWRNYEEEHLQHPSGAGNAWITRLWLGF